MFRFEVGVAMAAVLVAGGVQAQVPGLGPGTGPGPAVARPPSGPISREDARATAEEFARRLEAEYVNPETARRYAAAVRAKIASGAYDEVGTGANLAYQLTRDVQTVAPDGHLRVTEAGEAPGGAPRTVFRTVGAENTAVPMEPGPDKALQVAQWVSPGVAYIRIGEFDPSPEFVAGIKKFLTEHADARTLIFDVRQTPGGSTFAVNSIFPFLFSTETALMRADTRTSVAERFSSGSDADQRAVARTADVWTDEWVTRPSETVRGLFDAQVFVLTSGNTVSAAEHFALALQDSGRAKLIGQRTAGAGNFSLRALRRLNDRFETFIPVGRTYAPRSGRGWELNGIEPDIVVPSDDAFTEALELSGVASSEAQQISADLPLPPFRGPPNGGRLPPPRPRPA